MGFLYFVLLFILDLLQLYHNLHYLGLGDFNSSVLTQRQAFLMEVEVQSDFGLLASLVSFVSIRYKSSQAAKDTQFRDTERYHFSIAIRIYS